MLELTRKMVLAQLLTCDITTPFYFIMIKSNFMSLTLGIGIVMKETTLFTILLITGGDLDIRT
jgi:hypothetical protein